MKKFFIIPVLVLTVASVVMVMVGIGGDTTPVADNPHGFVALGVRPDFAVAFDGSVPAEEQSAKDLALELYAVANLNAKNAENMTAYAKCLNTMNVMDDDNLIDLDIVLMKTQDEYFRIDYRLENSIPMFDKLSALKGVLNNSLDIILTERAYINTSMDKLKYQKVRNSSIDEQGVPCADWSGTVESEEREAPIYNASQDGAYSFIKEGITADTIKTATVEYDTENSFYTVKLVLDCLNPLTTENLIDDIRKGSGDKAAYFTDIEVEFTVWDNGYFRSVSVKEVWSATAIKVFSFGTTQDYKWTFSYDEKDCNIREYVDFAF